MFGEVSAGGGFSRIATGLVVGVATGGLGYVAGPVLGVASISAEAAITSGVVAGVATAAGADTKVGVGCDGNGNNPHIEVDFKTKEGREFGFRTDAWDNHKPKIPEQHPKPNKGDLMEEQRKREEEASAQRHKEEQERILRQLEKEKEEEDYRRKMRDDINWSFNTSIGWNYEKVTTTNSEIPRQKIRNGVMCYRGFIKPDERIPHMRANNSSVFEAVTPKSENYDCVSRGKSKILAESGSRQWEVRKGRKYNRFSTFTPRDENEKLALKSFIFEETPLVWHLGRENINGQWYNHAWTDTDMDVLVPDGKRVGIPAPEWFSAYRRIEIKEMSKRNPNENNLKLAEDVAWRGYCNEFLWSNVKAINLMAENRIEESQAAVRQGLDYYDEAHRIYRNMKHMIGEAAQSTGEFIADFFITGGIDNLRKYANGELSAAEYEQMMREENLEDMAAIAAGAAWGASAGGAAAIAVPVVGTAAAPATTAAGATVGAAASYTTRRFTVALNRALERSSRRDSSISYRKVQKSGPNLKEAERKGTEGYKMGQTWENLKPVNKPEANRQIGKINKQAFGGGEMRTDGEKLYRFDNGHKNGKIHMERYEKIGSNKWRGCGEIDPETGNLIEGSIARTRGRIVTW